jgi:hypothetical protein
LHLRLLPGAAGGSGPDSASWKSLQCNTRRNDVTANRDAFREMGSRSSKKYALFATNCNSVMFWPQGVQIPGFTLR